MLVNATAKGYYNGYRDPENPDLRQFVLDDPSHFSKKWMEAADADAKAEVTKQDKAKALAEASKTHVGDIADSAFDVPEAPAKRKRKSTKPKPAEKDDAEEAADKDDAGEAADKDDAEEAAAEENAAEAATPKRRRRRPAAG